MFFLMFKNNKNWTEGKRLLGTGKKTWGGGGEKRK